MTGSERTGDTATPEPPELVPAGVWALLGLPTCRLSFTRLTRRPS